MTPILSLLRPLGEGGMGKVWAARHKGLETDVVVKFLATEGADRKEAEIRFAREAAAAAAVKSPHVVQVFDHGVTSEGTPYIVMELLEGRDLAMHLAKRGPMPPIEVAALIAQAAKALSRAHQAGVIHRDIKPENIFLCDGDGGEMFVKVLDFGIAKRGEHVTAKTSTGQVVGTPYYMSPEQILGEQPVDPRSDIWSLGVVAFEALTGKRPFDGPSVGAITLAIHRSSPRPSALVSTLPPAIDAWFATVCAQKPADRFQTVRDAAQALITAVGEPASTGSFRTPMLSLPDPSDPSLVTQTPQRSTTNLSSSFAAPVSRRGPPKLMLVGAFVAIAVLAALVVVATRKGKPTATNVSSVPATVSAAPASAPVASDAPSTPSAAPPADSTASAASATPPAVIAPVKKPKKTRPAKKASDDDIK